MSNYGVRRLDDTNPDEAGFVVDSWTRSYLNPKRLSELEYEEAEEATKARVKDIVSSPDVHTFLIEVPGQKTNGFVGWVCFEYPNVLHFTYVKFPYRKQGIATGVLSQIFGAEQIICTQRTPALRFHKERWNIGEIRDA